MIMSNSRIKGCWLTQAIVTLGFVCTAPTAWAQAAPAAHGGFVERVFRDAAGNHKYQVFLPAGYSPAKTYPVILYLHGAGERGTDGVLPITVGLGPYLQKHLKTFPFIAVFPQCDDTQGRILTCWLPESPNGRRALEILDEVERTYHVDRNHEILTGWSMGGYGAWALGAAFPQRWSAVVPVSGGGDPAQVAPLKNTPVWAFHGAKDAVVPVAESRKMVAALREAGGKPIYTEAAAEGHSIWDLAYASPELYRWMLEPQQIVPSIASLPSHPGAKLSPLTLKTPELPFIPALHIPNAVSLRLGNEMLQTLSDAVPQIVPRDALTGSLADIYDSTSAAGHSFSVQFSGITYSAQLTRAALQAYAPGRLNVQLAVANAQLSIGSTYVAGGRKSAVAGPISIMFGFREPIWLGFDVQPSIENGKIRLKLLDTRFSIPADNWSVSPPAGVSTQGLFMTQQRVTEGLMSGLNSSRGRVEQEVRGIVPSLIKQLEGELQFSKVDGLVAGIWPLPTYEPRLRAWPQGICTDAHGISIVLGLTAAAIDPHRPPRQPRWAAPAGPAVEAIPQSKQLKVGVASGVLEPLTELMIEAGATRVNVLDTPVRALKSLADPQTLAEAIPELKRYGENVQIQTELILAKPLRVVEASSPANPPEPPAPGSAAAGKGKGLEFQVPLMTLAISIKPDPAESAWMPFAELSASVRQPARLELVKPTQLLRALVIAWGDGIVEGATARFAPNYKPENEAIDVDRLTSVFTEGWREWTQIGAASRLNIPDVDFGGYTKLRATDVGWHQAAILATFGPAGLELTNSSSEPLIYETKGPYSGWGGPYTLKPGDSSQFPISYPMIFRRQAGPGYQMYTLPAGTHSEFRAPITGGPPQVFQARQPYTAITTRTSE
jgi:predicted esterase